MKIFQNIILLTVFAGFVCDQAFADAKGDLDLLKKEVNSLKTSENPESGMTTWSEEGRVLHQSDHGQGHDKPSFSPDGNAVHFGSIKENTGRRVIVAFNMKGNKLAYSGGDELPDKVIIALLNSGKVPADAKIDGCWLDPVKWIENSKLLITSELVSKGESGFQVSNFRCVWNLENGDCDYQPEFKSEKEAIQNFRDQNKEGSTQASGNQLNKNQSSQPVVEVPKEMPDGRPSPAQAVAALKWYVSSQSGNRLAYVTSAKTDGKMETPTKYKMFVDVSCVATSNCAVGRNETLKFAAVDANSIDSSLYSTNVQRGMHFLSKLIIVFDKRESGWVVESIQ